MDWTPIAPGGRRRVPGSVSACILAAAAGDHGSEPEQLAAINKVEVPAFIRSMGPRWHFWRLAAPWPQCRTSKSIGRSGRWSLRGRAL